jgi:phosphatidylglycerol:prolipoprotein diacylglycerol transferase
MYPEIFHIGPLAFAPYGLCVAFGIMLSVFLSRRANRQEGFLESYVYDRTMLMGIICALLGARMLYVLTVPEQFSGDWAGVFQVSDGGLVFYGGPVAAILYLMWHFVFSKRARADYEKKERWNRFARFADIAIPATVIGHAFGRLGCLLGGCCYGRPFASESVFSTHYPLGSDAYFADLNQNGVDLNGNVPVPLMEAVLLVLLFAWLLRVRRQRVFHGQVLLSYLVLYPAIRFILEIFRGDSIRGYVLEIDGLSSWLSGVLGMGHQTEHPLFLSTSQFISLIIIALAILVGRKLKKEAQSLVVAGEGSV